MSAAPFLQGMAQLRPPSPFDFDNSSSWLTWLLFEDCSFATGLYVAPAESGHFENVCRQKKRVNGKHTRKPLASSIELHAVAGERPNAKFVEILVDGRPFSFKVDSSAEVSVVPSTFSGVPSKLHDPESELKGPGNNILPVTGTYVATLSWHGKSTKQLLYVLATKTVPLLGFQAIQALGVCTFVDEVARTSQPTGGFCLDARLFRGIGTLPKTYTIRLQPNATPFSLSVPRRIPLPLRNVVKTELDKLESEGVIRPVDTPTDWCAGLVVVPKVSGGYRLCVDLTRINTVILRERHVLPTVEQCLALLGEATAFSKLDATSSLHQVKLSPESQELTTFITRLDAPVFSGCRLGSRRHRNTFSGRCPGSSKAKRVW
ncbi:uncharacterized protein LOC119399192 [Rhipicephalus sanguineus]|uniref:uncharacterized protein LOC119399192 n=1 Tax=Rhipicephalus sanguineus TaxID=34632 RepID=UPI0018931EFB|nr:uncharacterized protein LOC119399192 [Rhipicephalus sanguineus]